MKTIKVLLLLFVLPVAGFSHGYWFEVEPDAQKGHPVVIKMFYGEYSSEIREVGDRLDKMSLLKVSVIAPDGTKKDIQMKQTNTHWEGSYIPQQDGYYQVLGINDMREVQDWHRHNLGITRPIQYLRTQFTVGKQAETITNPLFLDVYCKVNMNNVEIYAVKDGKPMDKLRVRIVNPDAWIQDKHTNKAGFVSVIPNKEGLYLVEIEWIDESPGVFQGKAYETIRHKSDMTFTSRDMRIKL
jgi:uncharacterized GH25 family protein